jgi:hypothetical protein
MTNEMNDTNNPVMVKRRPGLINLEHAAYFSVKTTPMQAGSD